MQKFLTFIIFLSCILSTQNTFSYSQYPKPLPNEFDEFNEAYNCYDTFKQLWSALVKITGLRKCIAFLRNKGFDCSPFEQEQDKLIIYAVSLQSQLHLFNCEDDTNTYNRSNYRGTAEANIVDLATKDWSWRDNSATNYKSLVFEDLRYHANKKFARKYRGW